MLENTKGQSKNDNLEKLTTQGTQDEIKQSKNTTQCMLDTTMQTYTQLTQTTGKTGTKHRLCEIDVNITNGVIFFTHQEQYYIDIHVQI